MDNLALPHNFSQTVLLQIFSEHIFNFVYKLYEIYNLASGVKKTYILGCFRLCVKLRRTEGADVSDN